MIRQALVAAVITLSCLGTVRGEEPASADAAPVAKLFGKPITKADLQARVRSPSGEEAAEPNWGEVLQGLVLHTLRQRYLDENELRARESEIESFVKKIMGGAEASHREIWEGTLEKIRAKLDDQATPQSERAGLEKMAKRYERRLKGDAWPDAEERKELADSLPGFRERLESALSDTQRKYITEMIAYAERFSALTDEQSKEEWAKWDLEQSGAAAVPFIELWKFNRSLYKKYGGRILFQQGGLEAFDATKQWLEEREKAGDFEILDTTLLPGFWDYYTRDQSAFLIEEPEGTEFDIPWWEKEEPVE